MTLKTIAVLGAGSWGTAIAIHLAHAGHQVLLWGRNNTQMALMDAERCNQAYLPESAFPFGLKPTADLNHCLQQATELIIAVPSHAFADILAKLPLFKPGITWLTKGLNPLNHGLLSDLIVQRFGHDYPFAILSGPSFAKEVGQLLPTALTLASLDKNYQKRMHAIFHHRNLRVYLSHDIRGIQLCGTVKNVLAIACGISEGLGYGANTKAAIITRGLVEMKRLGLKMGALEESITGLAGLGDLVLTCTDNQSRNRRFGLYLGQGLTITQAQEQINQVIEGVYNAEQVCKLAKQMAIEMPICEQVNALLKQTITPTQAVINLMNRMPKVE